MKYQKLETIINEEAFELKENAGYSGSWSDGGSSNLLNKLKSFKESLIIKYDLRPSEYFKLNDIEVGEPDIFKKQIEKYKIKLAKNIKL